MDFELTQEQKLLADTVRTFTKQQSTLERFRKLRDEHTGWEPSVWQHMGELGWLAIPFAEDVGGFGGDFFDLAVVLEGLGTTLVPEPYIPSVVVAGLAIAEGGTSEQQQRWLPAMIEGQTSLAFAHAERHNRFASDLLETSAEPAGGGWHIKGQKTFVLNGHKADHVVVTARGPDGPMLFVVDTGAQGLGAREVRTMDGHGAAMIELDVTVPDENRLAGEAVDGRELIERVLDYGAAATCAEALGVCRSVLSMTREHLKTREQFGVPIGTFQALQHRAVDMFVHVELIRSMSTLAAGKARHADPSERQRAVSAAKAHVARSGRFVTQESIQLHGGIGITDEHDIGLFFKRMHALGTIFGDEHHHVHRFTSLPTFEAGL